MSQHQNGLTAEQSVVWVAHPKVKVRLQVTVLNNQQFGAICHEWHPPVIHLQPFWADVVKSSPIHSLPCLPSALSSSSLS